MALTTGTISANGASATWSGTGDMAVSLDFVAGARGTLVTVQRSWDAGATWHVVMENENEALAFDQSIDFTMISPSATFLWRLFATQFNRNVAFAIGN